MGLKNILRIEVQIIVLSLRYQVTQEITSQGLIVPLADQETPCSHRLYPSRLVLHSNYIFVFEKKKTTYPRYQNIAIHTE